MCMAVHACFEGKDEIYIHYWTFCDILKLVDSNQVFVKSLHTHTHYVPKRENQYKEREDVRLVNYFNTIMCFKRCTYLHITNYR